MYRILRRGTPKTNCSPLPQITRRPSMHAQEGIRAMAQLKEPVSHDDHIQGTDDAPVTLVEYGDYQCPYCGAAHPIVTTLQSRFGDQLRFVFRNFPLTEVHPPPD
jgi:protein-disulfide isomerase